MHGNVQPQVDRDDRDGLNSWASVTLHVQSLLPEN
jgi:hypothetical protein